MSAKNETDTRKRVRDIIDAYISGPHSGELTAEVLSWLMYDGHSEEKDALLEELWNERVAYEKDPENGAEILVYRSYLWSGISRGDNLGLYE